MIAIIEDKERHVFRIAHVNILPKAIAEASEINCIITRVLGDKYMEDASQMRYAYGAPGFIPDNSINHVLNAVL